MLFSCSSRIHRDHSPASPHNPSADPHPLNLYATILYKKSGGQGYSRFCIVHPPSISPNFRLRPSTSVLLKVESFLYPQSYCSLDLTQIHFPFTEEDRFDWFGTPHYPALFHAAAAHCSLDHRSRGW